MKRPIILLLTGHAVCMNSSQPTGSRRSGEKFPAAGIVGCKRAGASAGLPGGVPPLELVPTESLQSPIKY